MTVNPILNSDSYKLSHWVQYPPGTDGMYSYVAARGGTASHVLFFGLQALLKDYLSQRITLAHIDEAEALAALHGLPFNRAGFERIVKKHHGYWPVRIRAVADGHHRIHRPRAVLGGVLPGDRAAAGVVSDQRRHAQLPRQGNHPPLSVADR